jgi:aminoglycoside 6'-N-acetyltransferase I
MSVSVFIARRIDATLFDDPHDDVFDAPPLPDLVARYLAALHLHIAVATDAGRMVGMCSGVVYHHPDKPEQYWINELGVAGPWRRQGIARRLIEVKCDHAGRLGCTEAWVVFDPTPEAMGFYRSLGAKQSGENLAMFSIDLHA